LFAADELGTGAKFKGDSGEVFRDLGDVQPCGASVWIVNQRTPSLAAAGYRLEYDEVIHVPMQYGRQMKVAKSIKTEFHATGDQSDRVGDLHQGLQCGATLARREPTAKRP
jgi:hypothetical protein